MSFMYIDGFWVTVCIWGAFGKEAFLPIQHLAFAHIEFLPSCLIHDNTGHSDPAVFQSEGRQATGAPIDHRIYGGGGSPL